MTSRPVAMGALVIGTIVALLLTGCAAIPGSATPVTLQGKLHIVGSTALLPLATAAASAYHHLHPQVQIQADGGGSVTGLTSVTSQKSDIGDSDIYADPALYPDPNLTDHIVCVSPFTMIAGPGVNVHSLTRQQIIDVFSTGKIHNWQELGGANLPIVPVVRPATSGTRATFRKYILGGRDENGKLLQTDSSKAVLSTVASTPGAIGYIALSVVDKSVSKIAIDGKMAEPENIANGSYNFWSYEHMYTLGDSNSVANDFLDYMFTSETQKLAERMGYIPIAKMNVASITTSGGNRAATPFSQLIANESEGSNHES